MFNEIHQLIDQIHKLPDAQRNAAVAIAVSQAIGYMVYYIMLGVVVIVLGRRLIYATLSAWRETRRESPQ